MVEATTLQIAEAPRSLVLPLPAPGSAPKKAPLPWEAASPNLGLRYREITREADALRIQEHPLAQS